MKVYVTYNKVYGFWTNLPEDEVERMEQEDDPTNEKAVLNRLLRWNDEPIDDFFITGGAIWKDNEFKHLIADVNFDY